MKKLLGLLLLLSLAASAAGLMIFDRSLFYRDKIAQDERNFYNEGLRITNPELIRKADFPNLGVLLGGSLFHYWFNPVDTSWQLVNYSGLEETSKDTYAKLQKVASELSPKFIVINAGFCEIHTAVHSGGDVEKAIDSNMQYLRMAVTEARTHGIVPIISSLTPVRSAYLLPYSGFIELSSEKKNIENAAIQAYNSKIVELVQSENLLFFDFHNALADESGKLRKEFSLLDGEHLSQKGYRSLSIFFIKQLESTLTEAK